jgi:hypothetical protein
MIDFGETINIHFEFGEIYFLPPMFKSGKWNQSNEIKNPSQTIKSNQISQLKNPPDI